MKPACFACFLLLVNVFGGAAAVKRAPADLESLQAAFERLATTVDSLEAQLTSQQDTIGQLQQLVTQQQQKIAVLEGNRVPESALICERVNLSLPARKSHVAFTASQIEGVTIPGHPGGVIPFKNVITNVGNAYNSTTGLFTAPFDGVYFFIVNIDVSADYEAVEVVKNNHAITIADKDDTTVTHVAGNVVITLTEGDVIFCRHFFRDNAGYIEGGIDSTFSGFLLY